MLKSYLITAFRSFAKNKVFSLVNVAGLSVGLTAFILILLYVRFEFSYDNFHKHSGNVYRIVTKVALQGEVINHESSTYEGIIHSLKRDFPEIKAVTGISAFTSDGAIIRYANRSDQLVPLEKFNGLYADSAFFTVFSFPLETGDAASVLDEPYSAVISESIASKYFNNDAIGRILEFRDDEAVKRLKITGVIKEVPKNSHIKFDLLVNIPDDGRNFFDRQATFWDWGSHTYVLFDERVRPARIEAELDKLALASNGLKRNKDDYGQISTFRFQPLTDIHLFSKLDYEFEPTGNHAFVYSLLALGFITLLIAWVNYVNMSTAVSSEKIRAIGVRKAIGASRRSLIFQVVTESALFNIASLVLALLLVLLLYPFFQLFLGMHSRSFAMSDDTLWLVLPAFLILSTLISAGYPAWMVACMYPVKALKGKNTGSNLSFRKGLVIFQFTAAVVLLIVTTVAFRQLTFMKNKDLGINIDQVLVVKALNFDKETWSDAAGGYVVDSIYQRKAALFKNELGGRTSILNASNISHLPGQMPNWGTEFRAKNPDGEKAYNLKAIGIDYDFISTFQVKLLAGRNFSRDFPTDKGNEGKRAVLINEAAAKLLGFRSPEDAVSRHLSTYWGADYEIIGVVNSFHQLSLKENLTPLYFILQPRALSYFAVHFQTQDVSKTIGEVKKVWSRHFPDYPFDYFFLDEYFGTYYENEIKFGKVVGLFSALAIFIGCMGLFGLTSHAIVQRTKEIGIRKVLGASVSNVIVLFSSDLVKLILIASLIGIPVAYAGIASWLDNYAYRVSLGWWMFALPMVLILGVALLTVSLQTVKVAMRNPVDSLKCE